eukprot:6705305-Prymnesium_polylepis.1
MDNTKPAHEGPISSASDLSGSSIWRVCRAKAKAKPMGAIAIRVSIHSGIPLSSRAHPDGDVAAGTAPSSSPPPPPLLSLPVAAAPPRAAPF